LISLVLIIKLSNIPNIEANKMNGKVKFFNESKAFGFVTADDGKEYFVHQSALAPGLRLRENDSVTFDTENGDRGPKAVNVKKA
jgi:cold shock protein